MEREKKEEEMRRNKIKFGYEIETGKEVEIPTSHTVITGLTNEAGKTTALVGFTGRSGLRTIIFKTKIGEKAITEGTVIPPFYKESFDWEYAAELLEASRKEKLKFERSWIIRYSKNANNLLEFKRNIDNALAEGKLRELDKSVLSTLQAYLDKIIPELTYAPLSKTLDIRDGINIIDLERFKEETQGIIIKSVLEEVLNKEKNVFVSIPECWKYLPEKLGNPVKRPAEAFIRQGATNGNFLILDSQDITGVSKSILKQVSNWILGYQTEINEIKRTLDQIPLSSKSKPKPEEIATLKTGQFFVVTSEFVKKCYAQPNWLNDKRAKEVALGKIKAEDLEQPTHIAPFKIISKEEEKEGMTYAGMEKSTIDFQKKLNEVREDFIIFKNDIFTKFGQVNETISAIYQEIYRLKNEKQIINEDEIVMRILQKMPSNVNVSNPTSNLHFDKEALVKEILARVLTSGKVYEVSPLEKIKKDFLEEAKNKILDDISKLSNNAKKTLKYLESRGVGCTTNEICMKGFMYPQSGGGYAKVVNDAVRELEAILIGEKQKNGTSQGKLKERIKSLLGIHEATEQEIEQVYNHILMEMLK
ncbi:conserved hypothetical protein [Azospirillaceae bacterium]